ncbi:MAG: hypothetical protein IK147_04290 [Clostridia bacterium]|nr:hypothetical protein [Clostridia bacterium]
MESDKNEEFVYSESEEQSRCSVKKKRSVRGLIYALYSISVVCAYLLLGFLLPEGRGWTNFWFLFITIPVAGSIADVIAKKRVSKFNYSCFVTAVYCAIGIFAGIWHPTWVVFITIPAFHYIAKFIDGED